MLHRGIHEAALRRLNHSDHLIAVVECQHTNRRDQTSDAAALYITQRRCPILNLLQARPHFFLSVVAELLRLHDACAAGELICEQSVQSIELVIQQHIHARDRRCRHGRSRHY